MLRLLPLAVVVGAIGSRACGALPTNPACRRCASKSRGAATNGAPSSSSTGPWPRGCSRAPIVIADGGNPWRESSWTVETRGVTLERRGSYDVFEAERGDVPLQVRVRFKPVAKRLQADYPPALRFTDGSVALYVAQFDMFPMDSIVESARVAGRSQQPDRARRRTALRFRRQRGPGVAGRKTRGRRHDHRQRHLRAVRHRRGPSKRRT